MVRTVGDGSTSVEHARLLARAQMGLATAEFERGGLDVALQWLTRAEQASLQVADGDLRTLCLSQRATLLGRSGQIAQAHEVMVQAVSGLTGLESRDQSVLLLNFGVIRLMAGQLSEAWELFDRSASIAADNGHHREAFMGRFNQGYVAHLRGDLPKALGALREAHSIEVDVSGAATRLDRARVLLEAGLLGEAHEVLVEAEVLATGNPQRQVLGEIEVELARSCVLLGRFAEARTWAQRARRRFSRRSTHVWAARAELIQGQADLLAGHRVRAAWRTAESVTSDLAGADWLLDAEHRLIAAEAAWTCGEVDRVREHLAAVERIRLRLPLRAQLQAAHLKAHLARSDGQPAQARRILDRAARTLVQEQVGSASIDLRAATSMYSAPLAALHLDLVPDRPRAVFECTERWRASSQRLQAVQPPADQAQADLLTELREVRLQLRDLGIGAARKALLQREYQLGRAVRAQSWQHRSAGSHVAAVSYRATRERLDQLDADLLSLFVRRGRFYAIRLGGKRSRLIELGPAPVVVDLAKRVRADLDVAGRYELGAFKEAVWDSLHASLRALDELLIARTGCGTRRLVIVPHRHLTAFPWGMLPSLSGTPLVVAPSATDWTVRSGRPQSNGHAPVVSAVAGPGLSHADTEAAAVAGIWTDSSFVGSRTSTAAALQRCLAESDLVHVSAHGRHNQQNPMFASIQVGDGPLFVYDLEQSGVTAGHVVLSACELGQSAVQPGEEQIGLAAGLLRLGARSVLAGVARVPDAATATAMTAYHRALAAGRPADVALAEVVAAEGGLTGAFSLFGATWNEAR